ncbi:MAG: hypothetical protein RIC87_18330 [Kiloniellales bacterium]
MPWKKGDYTAPTIQQIKTNLNKETSPTANGTWIAMRYVIFDGKVPFHNEQDLGHTASTVPVSCSEARQAFAMRWVPAEHEAILEEIALKDGKQYLAPI